VSYGSNHPGLAHPKGVPAHVARSQRKSDQRNIDLRESADVRRRSGGRCELPGCQRPADHVHHLLGGNGVRGRVSTGSHLAENKIHLCAEDHRDVHAKVITLAWTDDADRFGTMRCVR
jgi:hypothetical protein